VVPRRRHQTSKISMTSAISTSWIERASGMGKFVAAFATIFVLLGAGSVPANAQASNTELSFWESVRDSDQPQELEAYLKTYPDGTFAPLARLRLERLKGSDVSMADATEVSIAESFKTRLVGKVYEGDELDDEPVIEGWEDLGGGLMIEPVWFHYFRRNDDAYLVLANMALPRQLDAVHTPFRIADVLFVPSLEKGQEVAFHCRLKGTKRKLAIVAVIKPDYENEEEWWKDIRQAWTISLDSGRFSTIDTDGVACVNEGWGR